MNPNLVFAAGVLVPQHIGPFNYFRDLKGSAEYPDATTLFPPVSGLGSVPERALELANQIVGHNFPPGDIHIIAHSMGGLDARCLLARNINGLVGRVVSLSTISTPHHGSPIADRLDGLPLLMSFPPKALLDLTTGGAPGFQDLDPVKGIRYFAYAGSREIFATRTFFEGPNDGLVSVVSATWPPDQQLAEHEWDADHFAEVGHDFRLIPSTRFDYRAAVRMIISRATGRP